jgi:hypothetical protein
MKKGKSHEDPWGLGALSFICVLWAPYYQGGCIEWVGEIQIIKKNSWTNLFRKSEHIRLPSQILVSKTGHARPPSRTCLYHPVFLSSLDLSGPHYRIRVKITGHVRLLDRTCPAKPFSTAAKSPAGHIRLAYRVTVNLIGHTRSLYRTCPTPQP